VPGYLGGVEPLSKWSVAELRAELRILNLTVSGNKQELYERLLEASVIEEDWEDEPEGERFDFDFDGMGRATLRTVKRFRVLIAAILIAGVLVGAVAFAGLTLLDIFQREEAPVAKVHMWQFTLEENNQTEVQTMFVLDDTTETISVVVPAPNNLSSVYIGAYWQESDEQPGGIVGCDEVTVEIVLTDVNNTALYTLSGTGATSQECDADGTEPWDHIWYQYDLDMPNVTSFEGTEDEALAIWDTFTGIGTGEWFIDVSVDTYAVWGSVCDCEDGEDVRLTVSYTEYVVVMSTVSPNE
jgi:hypothetical protein